jgi:hypothetical protein
MGQWHKCADVAEGLQPAVLIGSQEGHHRMPCLSQISQERCGHPFPVHNDAGMCHFPACLLIASQSLWQSRGQMLVSTRRRGQVWMPLLIMQQHQSATAQNLARTTNQPARQEAVSIDGFAVAIDVETRRYFLLSILGTDFPQTGRPYTQRRRQRLGSIGTGQLA